MALIVTDTLGNTYTLVVQTDGSLLTTPAPGVTPTPGASNSITVKALDLVKAGMLEIGALAAGETPSNEDQAWTLQKLQRVIDRMNARLPMIYNVNFSVFNLQANHSPHTIGPGADFDVVQRPQTIDGISLILSSAGGIDIDIPMHKRDDKWWANQAVKGLNSSIPTDFYYSPDWYAGSIYFWPVPTYAYKVRIESRVVLTELTTYAQNFTMPPAYWDAIVYQLAVSLCPSFERPASPELLELEKRSIKAIQVNNIASPRGTTADAGMPGVGSRGGFNYYDGMPS